MDFLGVDADKLRQKMIGLRGQKLSEKFDWYQKDMDRVLAECARALRRGRICTIIVGTNNNQLSKILERPAEAVPGLHELLTETAVRHDLILVKMMSRSIIGISNTMRREYILMLQKSA